MRIHRLVALIPTFMWLASCGGSGGAGVSPPPATTYTASSGVAQKGPLIKGSTVTAQEIDSALSPTGKQYSYQIATDLGTFTPSSTFGSQYIGLNATGYYFDEVQNGVSSGTVTLNSYSDLSVDSVLNVNLLTTLAYQRVNNLVVNSKMTFSAARAQAESEVLAALNIPAGSYGEFGTLDLSGTSDGDHILAAISSLFVYGNQAGPLSVLINNFQNDLGTHGALTSAATKSALAAAAKALNPATIAANLNQRYASLGVTLSATDIADWIDQDGDGVVGKFKFQVPDATPSTTFPLPAFVVDTVAGASVSVTAGQLAVNGIPVTGSVTVNQGDAVTVAPGPGAFPGGVLNVYLLSGGIKVARVSFISGLVSITITPVAPSIAKGLTQQLTATGTFTDSSQSDLTDNVTWASGTPTVATVSNTGLAQSLTAGSTTVTATSGSVSASVTLTVTAAVAESITITPAAPSSGVGLARQLTATGTFSDGTTADVTSIATWASSAPAIATVDSNTGLTTGVSLGTTSISAKVGSATQSVSLAIVSNTWTPGASLLHARYAHTATLLDNGKLLVAGGFVGAGAVTATTEIYDFATDTWTPAASLSIPHFAHTATLLPNGKVLVVGGGTNGPPIATSEIYDPVANTWTQVAGLSIARAYHSATLLQNGKVLVVGGTTVGPEPSYTTAEIYDPAANTWSMAANLPSGRTEHTATLLSNGTVLVAGGDIFISNTVPLTLAPNGLIYDPVADTWANTGNFSDPRDHHTATLLPSGQVVIAGGSAAAAELASVEVYDPGANAWSVLGSMLAARTSHTATLLPGGKILFAGGYTSGVTSSTELLDPATGTSSTAASLATARENHTATLLPNGVTVIVGGTTAYNQSSIQLVPAAELYW